jgi:hypothetical protein
MNSLPAYDKEAFANSPGANPHFTKAVAPEKLIKPLTLPPKFQTKSVKHTNNLPSILQPLLTVTGLLGILFTPFIIGLDFMKIATTIILIASALISYIIFIKEIGVLTHRDQEDYINFTPPLVRSQRALQLLD